MSSLARIFFPRAFGFAIDDLGWNDGSDLTIQRPQGPNRAGVKRKFDINDYRHIVTVGKAVGVRIQSLFILSEMDRENILANYPTSTWQREKWDNSARVNEEQREIMKYVIDEAGFMEFGLHGTGHEYWKGDGIQRRAEWYNLKDREPWPEEDLRNHIKAFKEIMAQYDITENHGHSFPESFVPCAYSYYWNPAGSYSLGKLLTEVGVKYANTDFGQIPELHPPQEVNGGGFDFNTHVINRINYGNPWYKLDSLPSVGLDKQETDMIESHWPNWLAQDDHLQDEVNNKWIGYYLSVQRIPNRYIAKNTEQLHSQWLYNKFTLVEENKAGVVEIDNTAMPDKAYHNSLLGNMVLKIKLNKGEHISSAAVEGQIIPAYFEQEGFGFLYLPVLGKKKYTLVYSVGSATMPVHVFNDGTYNVYSVGEKENSIEIELKIYGTQVVKVKYAKPSNVSSSSKQLVVLRHNYDEQSGYVNIEIEATDMQGVKGTLIVRL